MHTYLHCFFFPSNVPPCKYMVPLSVIMLDLLWFHSGSGRAILLLLLIVALAFFHLEVTCMFHSIYNTKTEPQLVILKSFLSLISYL